MLNSVHDEHIVGYFLQAADKDAESNGHIKSEGDLFVSGTQPGLMTESLGCSTFHASEYYPSWTVVPPTDELKQSLHHCTGWQNVARPADQTPAA